MAFGQLNRGAEAPKPWWSISAPEEQRKMLRGALLIGPLLIFLVVFAWLIALTIPKFSGASGAGYGSDFAVFYEAAHLQGEGLNPYNSNLLWHRERADFARAGLRVPADRGLVRVGNPPLFFSALQPLAKLPFRVAGIVWTSLMYAASLGGLLVLLRWLGWRNKVLPAAVFLAMPQVVIGAFYGDLIGLIFLAVCLSLVLAQRYPVVSGALLAPCWLKPHVALAAALLIWLFHSRDRAKVAVGFFAASLFFAGLMFALVGEQGIREWVTGLLGWSHNMAGQPEIASLAGLYYLWASPIVRTALSGLLVLGALTATLVTWSRYRLRPADPVAVAWLWGLWLLCAPYAHINDGILLTFPVLLLATQARERPPLLPWFVLTLYLMCSCVVVNRLPGMPFDLEPIKLSAVVACLAYMSRSRSQAVSYPRVSPFESLEVPIRKPARVEQ